MHAIPEGDKESRQSKCNRLAEAANVDADLQIPDSGECGYLVDCLSEIGESRFDGETLSPIGWSEIAAWSEATKMLLTPGELVAIRCLSCAYVNQHQLSRDPACPAPHLGELPTHETVEHKLKSLFSLMRK